MSDRVREPTSLLERSRLQKQQLHRQTMEKALSAWQATNLPELQKFLDTEVSKRFPDAEVWLCKERLAPCMLKGDGVLNPKRIIPYEKRRLHR